MANFSITAGSQVAAGTTGADIFNYGANVSAAFIQGLAGEDQLNANGFKIGSSTTILMEGGADTLNWSSAEEAVIKTGAGGDSVTFTSMSASELYLGDGSDNLAFSAVYSSTIAGGAGADTISNNGYDSAYVSESQVLLGAGADVFNLNMGGGAFIESTEIQLGGGNDYFEFGGSAYSSTVDGGAGTDTITFGEFVEDMVIQGGANADLITLVTNDSGQDGSAVSSTFFGGAGGDTIAARFDNVQDSQVYGDDGSDSISFGSDFSSAIYSSDFWGGAGSDTISLNADFLENSRIIGGEGADFINIGESTNTVGVTNRYLQAEDSNIALYDTLTFDSATTFSFKGINASAVANFADATFTTNSNAEVSFLAGAPSSLEGRVGLLDEALDRGDSVLFDATIDGATTRFLFVQAGSTSGSGIADDYLILVNGAQELQSNGNNTLTALST